MRTFLIPTLFVCWCSTLVSIEAARSLAVTRAQADHLRLRRENPDGWFTLFLPTSMGKVERLADVDGGFYRGDALEINYDYWTFGNTPNFLRDSSGNYSKRALLACPIKAKDTHTLWTRIDGLRALIQSCSDTNEWRGFHYVYYVTFPKMKVDNGQEMENGMFNLRIFYKDLRHRPAAERIVRSLDFHRPPNKRLQLPARQRPLSYLFFAARMQIVRSR